MNAVHLIFLAVFLVMTIAMIPIYNIISKKTALDSQDFLHEWYDKKTLELERSEADVSIDTYIKIMVAAPLLLLIVLYLTTGNALLAVAGAIIGVFLPKGFVKLREQKNISNFDERYARALQQMASSLKAGMSILEAVRDVADSKFIHPSLRRRFSVMALDLQMGVSVSEAFHNFADKVNSKDARDTAIAIDVQNEVGGHEADVIEEIAENIHDRIMLRKEIKSLFASTSMLVWVMDFLPFIIMIIFFLWNRQMVDVYFKNPLMTFVLVGILFCFLLGSVINHTMLNKTLKGE